MTGKTFTGGKKTSTTTSEPSQDHDPVAIANQISGQRASAVKAEVTGNIILNNGVAAFRNNPEKRDQLLNALVEKRVISKADADLAFHGKESMISMLTKIGEYADVILDEKIVPFLQPGYSVLYQLALLIQDLKAIDADRLVDRTQELLLKYPGPVTRDYLSKRRKELEPSSQIVETGDAGRDVNPDSAPQSVKAPSGPVKSAPARAAQDNPVRLDREPVGTLLLTPNGKDVAKLIKPYPGGGELPFCLRYSDIVAQSAALMMMARVGDLPRLADKLSLWGFTRFKAIYALAQPTQPDLMNVDAIAICERGSFDLFKPLLDWPDEKDPLKLAESLLNQVAGRRVHLFAQSETPGWESVVGEANWSEANDE